MTHAGKRILLLDDDAAFLKVTRIFLERLGYQVNTCSRGELALEMMTESTPDLLVMDIMMPGLSGFDMLSILKQEKRFPNLRIVVVTGRTDPLDASKARNLGAHRILYKPYSREELTAVIKDAAEND